MPVSEGIDSALPGLARRTLLGAGLATVGAGVVGMSAACSASSAAPKRTIDLDPPAVDPTTQSLVPIPSHRITGAVAALGEIVREVLARTGVPGLSAAVVHRGKVLYAKGFGVRDINTGVPVDASTVFHLASVSKSLSATVVAGLVSVASK